MYKFTLAAFLLLLVITAETVAQQTSDTVSVLTTAICSSCKNRIENDLSFEAGVRKVTMDLDTKRVSVVYNPKRRTRIRSGWPSPASVMTLIP